MTRRSTRIRLVPVLLSLLLVALFAASTASAVTHTLGADADTYIRYNSNEGNNYGNNDHMFLRQRDHNSGS